jgi:hypothetical protein
VGIIGECPKEPLPHHTDRDEREKMIKHRGWKKKKLKWKPYKPTAYDLERDKTLAEERLEFDWKSYREFKAEERKRNPSSSEDALYRTFGRPKGANNDR